MLNVFNVFSAKSCTHKHILTIDRNTSDSELCTSNFIVRPGGLSGLKSANKNRIII